MVHDIGIFRRTLRQLLPPMTRLKVQNIFCTTRIRICNDILKKIGGKTYLEIGVYNGHVMLLVDAQRKIGVDPIAKPADLDDAIEYYSMESDRFFLEFAPDLFKKDKLDVVLVDGLHESSQARRDIENSLRYISDRGVVVVHDCNPRMEPQGQSSWKKAAESAQKLGLTLNVWNGDVWKAMAIIRATKPDLEAFVFDCDYGVGIVRKGRNTLTKKYSIEEVNGMTFEDFDKNRKDLIGLTSLRHYRDFILSL